MSIAAIDMFTAHQLSFASREEVVA